MNEILLSELQRRRLGEVRRKTEVLQAQIAGLQECATLLLCTVLEMSGADPEANYTLSEDGSKLVLTAKGE